MNLRSQPFNELLDELLVRDESISASKILIEKASNDLTSAKSSYTPKLSITVPYGYEQQVNNDAPNTHLAFAEYNMKVSQNILDFGVTRSSIDRAKTNKKIASNSKKNIVKNKIFEAISAYLNYIKAYEVYEHSKKSEKRIKEVSNLEDAKVARGGGLATNVLQSKAQLAGANASKVRAEGDLLLARNRFYNVFKRFPSQYNTFSKPFLPEHLLPTDLKSSIKTAMNNNIDLGISELSLENAQMGVKAANGKFFPSLKAVAEYKNKRDSSGVIGTEIDQIYKLELSYPISIGGPGVLFYKERADYRSAVNNYLSSKYTHDQMKRNVEEAVRNAWQTKETSKSNAEYLTNQANISGEFFDLAMKEVQLGNRQLIDILSSETSYINAISAAESAYTDYEISVYQLLLSMGILDQKIFNNVESNYDDVEDKKQNNDISTETKDKISIEKNTEKEQIKEVFKDNPPKVEVDDIQPEESNVTITNMDKDLIPSHKIALKKEFADNEPMEIKENLISEGLYSKKFEIMDEAIIKKFNIENNIPTDLITSKSNDEFNRNIVKINLIKKDLIKSGRYKIQFGVFSSYSNAEKQSLKIEDNDFDFLQNKNNLTHDTMILSDKDLFRLQSKNDYDLYNAKIICKGYKNSGFECIIKKL